MLVGGIPTPLKNIFPTEWKNKIQVPNHQPVMVNSYVWEIYGNSCLSCWPKNMYGTFGPDTAKTWKDFQQISATHFRTFKRARIARKSTAMHRAFV
jgi:hypothetical protein